MSDEHLNEKTKRASVNERDDFWDIDMLIPKRTAVPRRAPGATDTEEISFSFQHMENDAVVRDAPLTQKPSDAHVIVRHAIPQHGYTDPAEEVHRTPTVAYDNAQSLIHRVEIYPWSSKYHYYRDFCTDAARYIRADEPADEVPYVSFFSYVPQYSQLRKDQLRYYLYWRREFRKGNVLKTDDSYLYLYIYEIINTAGYESDPAEGLEMLFRLFYTYGRQNARLSQLLSEWIVDFALIFRLSIPEWARREHDYHRAYRSALKEFYVSSPGDPVSGYADLLLRFSTAYDYRKSHFYKDSNTAYFDRFLPGALAAVLTQYSNGSHLFSSAGLRDSHMMRNAFEQALCSHRIRFRIEVDYASFSRSHEMRYLVSDILKYTENRLRAFLGIKSRLTVYSLSQDVKKCIDRYCDENFPHKSQMHVSKAAESIPSYEKLYDLPKTPLDLSNAAKIELDSWETTKRLTEAFSEDTGSVEHSETVPLPDITEPPTEETPPAVLEMPTEEPPEAESPTSFTQMFRELYPFLEAAYRSDYAAQQAFAAQMGMLPDLIADRINEIAADETGDILLIDAGGGYEILDEYRDLFTV